MNRWLRSGLWLIAGVAGLTVPAGLVSPGLPGTQHRELALHPPMIPRIVDDQGHWRLPFVYPTMPDGHGGHQEDRRSVDPLVPFGHGEPYRLLGLFPTDRHLLVRASGAPLLLCGADRLGRDVLARTLWGARVSLAVALMGLVVAMAVALLVGGVAGFFGGVVDLGLMRLAELVAALPGLYVAMVVREALGRDLEGPGLLAGLVMVLSLLGWAGEARIVRALVRAERHRGYVEVARVQGLPPARILARHVLPNLWGYVVVAAAVSFPYFILGEAALSFLGIGVQEPSPSLGLLLSQAQALWILRDYPWNLAAPGACLFVVVLGANLVADGLGRGR